MIRTPISSHPDWKDPLTLPISSKEAPAHEGKGKVEDPLTKEGIVGTFCRAMGTIQNAMDLTCLMFMKRYATTAII